MKFDRSELYYFTYTLNKKANQTAYSHTTLFNQSLVSDLAFSLGSYKKDEHTKKLIAKIKQSLKEKIFYIFIVVFWSYTHTQKKWNPNKTSKDNFKIGNEISNSRETESSTMMTTNNKKASKPK